MKDSSCKHCLYCATARNFLCLFLIALGVVIGVVAWHRFQGKPLAVCGYMLSAKKSTGKPLIFAQGKGKKVLASLDDFEDTLRILERGEPGMQFLAALPEKEQMEVYNRIINDYIVMNYLIKKYIDSKKIESSEDFKKEYENYTNIMMNNFYTGIFQKSINDSIIITDEQAQVFYENARFEVPEFMNPPFAMEVPGIEARAVRIEEGKDIAEYTKRLKDNKEVMNLGRLNRSGRGVSTKILDALESMKDGDVQKIQLDAGISFALYRVKEHVGKWAAFDDVSEQVKQVMRMRMIEKRSQEVLNEIRAQENIIVDENVLNQFLQEKRAQQEALKESLTALAEQEVSEKS